MIDCGEGTQNRLAQYNLKHSKIDHIFISHLHGDHFFGLIGLISTMHLYGRKKDLHLYGPFDLSDIITVQLRASGTLLRFKLVFHGLDGNRKLIFENDQLTVETIPLNHRINCQGFLFREKRKPRKINKEKLPENFPLRYMALLKKGEDIIDDSGTLLYTNKDLTFDPPEPRSYAYCSDTKYEEDILDQIKEVDLLYHEATFMSDMESRADETYHSTAAQAASIAKIANVNKLILGHYSSRYKNIDPLLSEAKSIFPGSLLAIEGETFEIIEKRK